MDAGPHAELGSVVPRPRRPDPRHARAELPPPRLRELVVRTQYHFWPGEQGWDAWDVARLIRLAEGLPVIDVPLDSISEVDTVYWFHGENDLPTVRNVITHARLIRDVDPSYPVILGGDGRV